MFLLLLLTTLSPFSNAEVDSQAETSEDNPVIIHMNNGEEYAGEIISQNEKFIVLLTINGEFHLLNTKIKSIEEETYQGTFTFEDPNKTRYFFAPSASPMKKNEGYYQNVLVTTNFVNYGVLNNLSVGGGVEFISTVLGEPIWFFTPKVGFDLSDRISVGGGVLAAGVGFYDAIGLGYGVVTVGSDDSHFTAGTGYGVDNSLVFLLSGAHRVNESISLLSENYVLSSAPNPLSSDSDINYFGIQGVRILAQKNTFDVGAIIVPFLADIIPALPYVAYSRSFN
jgi:hypothetical protein